MLKFLGSPMDAEEARRRIAQRFARREDSFLEVVERGIYGVPRSPYRRLLDWAGIDLGDVTQLVRDRGVEGTLEALHDAGVSVALQEVKGQRPIVRPGLELHVRQHDFDNPVATRHWRGTSGGSSGVPARISIDFDSFESNVVCYQLTLEAFGARERRTLGMWLIAPPGVASVLRMFYALKVGERVERWWTPNRLSWRGSSARHSLLTAYTVGLARCLGHHVVFPRHLPPDDADVVARWLAAKVCSCQPAIFSCSASNVARVCAAAQAAEVNIEGTLFLTGGEPYTPTTAQLVAAAGARAAVGYYMTELGQIGVPCADAHARDEVHLTTDVVGVIQRPHQVSEGESVQGLYYTSLSTSSPKLMLNVESGDYGVLEARSCSCSAQTAGLSLHLHGIGSYEKLTIEGTHFFAGELAVLVHRILPRLFGGSSHDYQFVEERRGATRQLVLLASPRLGSIDEPAVARAVVDHLESLGIGQKVMTEMLTTAGALQVRREGPSVTDAGKTPVLR